jgi:site-specific DNA recombinase
MKRCYAYIRVSTVKQAERSSSLQEQRDAIERYAQKHNLAIAEWFVETETAAKQGRKEFGKLMARLRRGKADGLLLHKIDRGARNLKDWACINDLIDAGIAVHFAHESLDMSTRGGRLTADIQAVISADFIRNLRDETRKGFYGRLKQGFYPLPAPRGYLDQGAAKAKTIDPDIGPLVAQAFDLYASGSFGLEQLRHEMWRRGLRSRSGTPLSFDALARLLRNPFYVGLIRINRTHEVFEGAHEPLVTKATFEKVQATMDGRVFSRPLSHEFLFRRLVRCAACSRTLTGEVQRGHVYYRCHGRTCRGTSFREADLSRAMSDVLRELRWDEEEVEDFRDVIASLISEARQSELARNAQLTRDIAAIAAKLDRLTDLLIAEHIEPETYQTRRASLLMQRHGLQEQIGDGGGVFWESVLEKFEHGNVAYSEYISAQPADQRNILNSIGSNAVPSGKNVAITTEFPFEQLRKWRISQHGAPCQGQVRIPAALSKTENRLSRAGIIALLTSLEDSDRASTSSGRNIQSDHVQLAES